MKKRRPRQAKKTAKKRTVKKSTRPHEVEVERNYSVMIGTFSYGGNGGIPNMAFDTAYWIANQMLFLERHPQIDRFGWHDIADTPIPMTRNQMIETARRNGYDYLLIVDSDMAPDLYVNQDGTPVSEREPTAKPFLESSLKFAMERYGRGPVIVAAPYCGPPPIENVYMFLWRNKASDHPEDSDASLEQYTREEASYEVGIAPVAAAPTGLMLIDLRIVEITEPKLEGDNPWFYYQYPDILKTFKHATEDVTFTRDISLRGCQVYGYNPLFCNWDSWAGHWKMKCVGKPQCISADDVADSMRRAILQERPARTEPVVHLRTRMMAELEENGTVILSGEPDRNGDS